MQRYVFTVRHPEHGEARVTAEDRLHAVVEAAHAWGINMWTGIARECAVELEGKAEDVKRETEDGGAVKAARSTRGTKTGAKRKKAAKE